MPEHMEMPWMMGNLERLEMAVFWVAALILILALVVSLRRPAPSRNRALKGLCQRAWRSCIAKPLIPGAIKKRPFYSNHQIRPTLCRGLAKKRGHGNIPVIIAQPGHD